MDGKIYCPKCGAITALIDSSYDWAYVCTDCGNVIKI